MRREAAFQCCWLRDRKNSLGISSLTQNIFGHPTGVRQISLKPHRDLAHQQGCDQGDLDIQMPHYNLALEKHGVLRWRGHSACFVRFPTLSSDPARKWDGGMLPSSGTCLQGVFKDHFSRQFLYRTATLRNLLSLFSSVGNYSCMSLWPCKKRKHLVQSIHAPFPLPLVSMNAWPAVPFNHTWPRAVSQMPPLKSARGCGEAKGKQRSQICWEGCDCLEHLMVKKPDFSTVPSPLPPSSAAAVAVSSLPLCCYASLRQRLSVW